MLPLIIVEPNAIDLTELDSVQRRLRTTEFLRLWTSSAILNYGDCGIAECALVRKLGDLSPGIRTLWTKAFGMAQQRRLLRRGPRDWSGHLDSLDRLKGELLVNKVDLALVSTRLFGTNPDAPEEFKRFDEIAKMEICRFDSAVHSTVFQTVEAKESRILDAGYPVESVWEEFFRPYVEFACSMVVVDRFAVSAHCSRRDGRTGLLRLLQGIPTVGGRKIVRVFSASQPGEDLVRMKSTIEEVIDSQKPRRFDFELFMLPDAEFGQIFHFRLVRFDALMQVRTDTGLEVLEGHSLYRPATIQVRSVEPEIPRLEQRFLTRCNGTPLVKCAI